MKLKKIVTVILKSWNYKIKNHSRKSKHFTKINFDKKHKHTFIC